ncbi:MAG: AsmA-like C-terminal domain-containing protein [Syntrophaceae bacterium]|nr:AsmA-like C-terminal domain-containing protein [Syntrophaceae bacterium]
MTITRKKIIIAVLLLLILMLVGISATVALRKLYRLDTYKSDILAEMRKSLNREVQYEQSCFSILYGPSFVFSNVVIRERDATADEPFIGVDRVSFRLALLPLLAKRIVIRDVILEQPRINLQRYRDGVFNISDLLEKKAERPIRVKALDVRNGVLTIRDQFVNESGINHVIQHIDFHASNLTRGGKSRFRISAEIVSGKERGTIRLSGKAKLAELDRPLLETALDAKISGKNLDAAPYWDYYRHYVPFEKILGRLDVETTFKGTIGQFAADGNMKVKGFHFLYPQVFHAALEPKDLHFACRMTLNHEDIRIESLDFFADGFNARGDCSILDLPSKDPRIVAHAVTDPFTLETHRQYIPFGIIPKGPSEFIEKHILAGKYRLDEGRLDGRVSEIAHMEQGDNHRVLCIRGKVLEGGLVAFGERIPTFNSIRGELLLEGKDFILRNMSGKFGSSPFTLDGKITDYCLDKPKNYPFSMAMAPGKPEVDWLVGDESGKKITYSGASTLRLNGTGPTHDYHLEGEWILDQIAYNYSDIIRKPAGKANRIQCKGQINDEGFSILSLQYVLAPLNLKLRANYQGEKETFVVRAESNSFPIGSVAGNMPFLEPYHPQGQVKIALQGDGNTLNPRQMKWGGGISLKEVSFLASENIKPVTQVTGEVHLTEENMESAQISAMIGNSRVIGKASLTDFQEPSVHVDLFCPILDLQDLGFSNPHPAKKLTRVRVNMTGRKDQLIIHALSGHIDDSAIRLKGELKDFKKPVLEAKMTSPYLDIEDVVALSKIKKLNAESRNRDSLSLKMSIAAEQGKWRDLKFKNLRANLTYANQVIKFGALDFGALGGNIGLKGSVDLSREIPQYKLSVVADTVKAEELFATLGWQRVLMTGPHSLQGEMSFQAKDLEGVKKTATGTFKLKASRGTIKGYGVLAKIFSMLNVSQLFKFQLPDMVADGMPYNEINGTFTFRDSIVSSNDLFINSDAMNIGVVGKIDMLREEIDATYGVQPLQTVDKIVSSIPIIGWVITGKEGTFVMTYFEAKGKLSDPTVTAIPFQSMATGVSDIFKRVFQLPVKIFTDPGEVLIGN